MKNKTEKLPRIAVKFANMVFVLGMLYSILLVVFSIYKIYNPPGPVSPAFHIISILLGAVFAVLFGFGLKKLSNNLKVNLSLLFFTVGITVYGFETYLELYKSASYDSRTKMEVLDDLSVSGVEAYPNANPNGYIFSNGLTSKKGRIYPFAGISNKTIVFCKESGFWSIYESDEHGFNNPKGLYEKNKVDILLTGDSFSEGACVKPANSISAWLRQLNFNTISVGKGGNGPLIELASLKEYARPLKPKIVLWLYYVNDLIDLKNEMQSSLLRKYLNEDDYSQNLISRQKEIDDVLKNYIQIEWERQKNKDNKIVKKKNEWIINLLKLTELRRMINLRPIPATLTAAPVPKSIFRDILQKSNQMTSGMNGKMYFVYLPSFMRYSTGKEDPYRDFIMQTATELDIPIIDIHKEVFEPHPNPLSLFPLRGHYNSDGYKLVAEVIGKRLEADGYVSIKSKE